MDVPIAQTQNRADHETFETGGDDRAVTCSSPVTPRREPGGWRKRHWLCLPRATRKEGMADRAVTCSSPGTPRQGRAAGARALALPSAATRKEGMGLG